MIAITQGHAITKHTAQHLGNQVRGIGIGNTAELHFFQHAEGLRERYAARRRQRNRSDGRAAIRHTHRLPFNDLIPFQISKLPCTTNSVDAIDQGTCNRPRIKTGGALLRNEVQRLRQLRLLEHIALRQRAAIRQKNARGLGQSAQIPFTDFGDAHIAPIHRKAIACQAYCRRQRYRKRQLAIVRRQMYQARRRARYT